MAIKESHKLIWDTLMSFFANPYGVAGLMGNLFAESSLDPKCLTGGGLKTKDQKETYLKNVKSGKITPEDFTKDGIAIGIVQWRYWSRKEALFLYCRDNGFDIDNLLGQLNFLYKEIATYKTVYNTILTAKSIKEASDIVMERYEKPGNITDKAKEKRAAFGQECYDMFALNDISTPKRYVTTTADKVNFRNGNGKNYAIIFKSGKAGEYAYEWVATADNGWHAVVAHVGNSQRVLWVSPDFSKVLTG